VDEAARSKPQVYIFLGPPGVGKGTQAYRFARALSIPHVATGDMLRDAAARKTPLGLEAKSKYMDQGKLVPDEVVQRIVEDRLRQEDCKGGCVLDGFPRTAAQAEFLEQAAGRLDLPLGAAFYLDAPEEVVVERTSGRRACPSCGANYHVKHLPPKKEGTCDECGTELIWRPDDRPETVRERQRVYRSQTAELVDWYEHRSLLARIDASGDVETIRKAILDARSAGTGASG